MMPLAEGSSRETIASNIKEMIRAGHDPKQAAAAAYREAGEDCDLTEDEFEALAKEYAEDSVSVITFAIDRASARRRDLDGRLHVELTNISKATVNPYYGREIPLAGLDPNKVYQVFREPAALAAAAPTFNNIPLMDNHIIVSADDPQKSRVVGSTGTDATFDGEYLRNSLVVWDAAAIARIESGEQKEISCAYRYVATLKSGTYKGLPYDVVMRDIVGNHVALVQEGRAGPDVVVEDSKLRGADMKFTKIKGTLAAKFATDSAIDKAMRPYLFLALDEMEEEVEAEDGDPDEEDCESKAKDKAKDMKAKDEAEAEEKKAADKRAKDKAAKDKRARDKAARDAEGDPPATVEDEDPEEKEKAMDAAIDKRVQAATDAALAAYAKSRDELEDAKAIVMPICGSLHGMDSADAVYRFALDGAHVDHKDIKELSALKQMVKMIPKPGAPANFTMDSADRSNIIPIRGLRHYA